MTDTKKVWEAIEGIVSQFNCTLSRTGDVITIDCNVGFIDYANIIHDRLRHYPWYFSVGITADKLIIYIKNSKRQASQVIRKWKNLPIEIKVIGNVKTAIAKSESEIKQGKARILNKKEFKKRYDLK